MRAAAPAELARAPIRQSATLSHCGCAGCRGRSGGRSLVGLAATKRASRGRAKPTECCNTAPVVCRIAFREPVEGPGPRIFRRRHHRRSDHRSVAHFGQLRDRPQHRRYLQRGDLQRRTIKSRHRRSGGPRPNQHNLCERYPVVGRKTNRKQLRVTFKTIQINLSAATFNNT